MKFLNILQVNIQSDFEGKNFAGLFALFIDNVDSKVSTGQGNGISPSRTQTCAANVCKHVC